MGSVSLTKGRRETRHASRTGSKSRKRADLRMKAAPLSKLWSLRQEQQGGLRAGDIPAHDPFFGFTRGQLANHVFPHLNPQSARTMKHRDLLFHYQDRLSRDPSFDCVAADEDECRCHQVTNVGHGRTEVHSERIKLELDFVDDMKLILGDWWFPGAAGMRFVYEASTRNAGFFVSLGTIPCAQLLFIYTVKHAEDEDDEEKQVELEQLGRTRRLKAAEQRLKHDAPVLRKRDQPAHTALSVLPQALL